MSALYDHLNPAAASNPFPREKMRWQAYLAFFLMLHQGLHRAEVLLLSVDAIKSAYDNRQQRMRYWLNVQANRYAAEEDDPRYSRPSIKTAQSIRQVPVSDPVAKLVQTYVENYRGCPGHTYLLSCAPEPNQIEHVKARLDGVRRLLATEVGENPFPDGPDLSTG